MFVFGLVLYLVSEQARYNAFQKHFLFHNTKLKIELPNPAQIDFLLIL